jgi:hypothetical protein
MNRSKAANVACSPRQPVDRKLLFQSSMWKPVGVACVLAMGSAAWAGPTAHVGREITKGVGQELKKELQEEAPKIDLRKGAKDIGGGILDSVADHGSTIDRGAQNVGRELARGFFVELRNQLGPDGKGPLARSMAGAGEQGSQQLAHGIVTELAQYLPECQGSDRAVCIDALVQRYAYQSAKSAARGAADGAPPWASVFIGAAGFGGGLLASALVALLLGQRRARRELAGLRPRTV